MKFEIQVDVHYVGYCLLFVCDFELCVFGFSFTGSFLFLRQRESADRKSPSDLVAIVGSFIIPRSRRRLRKRSSVSSFRLANLTMRNGAIASILWWWWLFSPLQTSLADQDPRRLGGTNMSSMSSSMKSSRKCIPLPRYSRTGPAPSMSSMSSMSSSMSSKHTPVGASPRVSSTPASSTTTMSSQKKKKSPRRHSIRKSKSKRKARRLGKKRTKASAKRKSKREKARVQAKKTAKERKKAKKKAKKKAAQQVKQEQEPVSPVV